MKRILIHFYTRLARNYRKLKIINQHKGAIFSSYCVLNISSPKQFSIGNKSSIGDFTTIIVGDDNRNKVNPAKSILKIGSNTYIGEMNNIRAAGGTINIGNDCLISQHVTIVASNHSTDSHSPISSQPWSLEKNFIIIEDDVWIGANSVILPGVTVYKGAIIAAGSVVTKDVDSYTVVKGNPAKFYKNR